MRTPKPFSHCPACGAPYDEHTQRACEPHCPHCGFVYHRTPAPVACLIVPYDGGVILIERRGTPRPGALAFPGGFVRFNETWREAAARECREEACVMIPNPNASIRLVSADGPFNRGLLFIVGIVEPEVRPTMRPFSPSDEVAGRRIVRPKEYTSDLRARIAFPGHLKLLNEILA